MSTTSVSFRGTFTTLLGDTSPGNGDLNGGSAPSIGTGVKGTLTGSYKYAFYSSWKTANKALVETKENDAGNTPGGRDTTDAWVEQFFGPGATFYTGGVASNSLGTTGSWTYTAAPGSNPVCPNVSSQWVDASPDWGANASDGNILAPAADAC